MKSYTFHVVLEQDAQHDKSKGRVVWRAHIPALAGAHAWGDTTQQALQNLRNAVDLILEDMAESGEALPREALTQAQVSDEPLLTVTV